LTGSSNSDMSHFQWDKEKLQPNLLIFLHAPVAQVDRAPDS
jgi:hypothetical protein